MDDSVKNFLKDVRGKLALTDAELDQLWSRIEDHQFDERADCTGGAVAFALVHVGRELAEAALGSKPIQAFEQFAGELVAGVL